VNWFANILIVGLEDDLETTSDRSSGADLFAQAAEVYRLNAGRAMRAGFRAGEDRPFLSQLRGMAGAGLHA